LLLGLANHFAGNQRVERHLPDHFLARAADHAAGVTSIDDHPEIDARLADVANPVVKFIVRDRVADPVLGFVPLAHVGGQEDLLHGPGFETGRRVRPGHLAAVACQEDQNLVAGPGFLGQAAEFPPDVGPRGPVFLTGGFREDGDRVLGESETADQ
jgi:hypothetical protein